MPTDTAEPAKDTGAGAAAASAVVADNKGGAGTSGEGAGTGGAKGSAAAAEAEIKLTLPSGSQLDAEHVKSITDFAKSRKLSQEQAQALLERENQTVSTYVEGQKQAAEKTKTGWVDELKADKEIGGEAFDKNVELAKRVAKRFGSEAFLKGLAETGFGNHPELVRAFVRIGKAMSEDQFVHGGNTTGAKKSPEEVFYGASNA